MCIRIKKLLDLTSKMKVTLGRVTNNRFTSENERKRNKENPYY